MCKNVTAPMIAMLGHSEIDTEISDVGIETVKYNDCRGVSEDDRDANCVLAVTQERARFSHKDEWKFINSFI